MISFNNIYEKSKLGGNGTVTCLLTRCCASADRTRCLLTSTATHPSDRWKRPLRKQVLRFHVQRVSRSTNLMLKCSLKRLLQLRVITCIFYALCLVIIIQLYHTRFGQYNYKHVPEENLQNELYWETNPNLVKKSKVDCKYDEILTSTKSIDSWEVNRKYDDFSPAGIANGSFVPEHCNPRFSVAILVTYRNRQKQLDVFLPYMHNFLRKQNIHYKIYLIEQQDDKLWNKGVLYNIGAKQAISEKFPCLILHDVDLLPLDESNLYACARLPRHMSASLDKFRYVLPYKWLVGGVLAVRADHYREVNGFSARFEGWGGEDDDFYMRLEDHNLSILRFPRTMSQYKTLPHRPEARNAARLRVMAANRARRTGDGLDSLHYTHLRLTPHRLFTLLAVRF